jgi:hypothetical protein
MQVQDSPPALNSRRHGLLSACLVILVGMANVGWRLGTLDDWWFEDDPLLYAGVLKVPAPWLFFYDVAANRLATAGPNELAPMLFSSMWLDLWLAPRSTAWSYAHSGLIYLATSAAFHVAMLRLLRERWLALATTIAWMLLPSTNVLVEFVSTRHYLIGMFWALLAAISVDDALKARRGSRSWQLLRVAVFTWLSIISKEFFPPAVLTMTFLWFAWRRDWRGAAIPVVLGALYAIYRIAMTEPSLVYYGNALMSPSQTVKLLLRLPYMTYAGWAGYAALALTVLLLRRQVRADRAVLPVVAIGGATLAVSLLVIYPVGNPVANSWNSFGTWYRTPCVINTLLLVAFAYAVGNLRSASARVALMAMLSLAVLAGAHRTAEQWDRMKSEQWAEAQFIFENPEETLLSQTRAVWFLPGVAALYPERRIAAFVSRWELPRSERYLELLRAPRPFWVYEEGRFRQGDPAMLQRLFREGQ